MPRLAFIAAIIIFGTGLVTFFTQHNQFDFTAQTTATSSPQLTVQESKGPHDIENQKPLSNPPAIIKAIYATGWSAGSEKRLTYLLQLIEKSELNAIVIDIKDYTGKISYNAQAELIKKYDAAEKRIPYINKLIKRLHDAEIYVIGRVAVFQDQQLILKRPDLAVYSSSTDQVWRDRKQLGWADPTSEEVWAYNLAVAQDAVSHGFDEINFDYIRFPSDGNLRDVIYPHWNGTTLHKEVMRRFFAYLREHLPQAKISADLFGLVLLQNDDLGIGQYLENVLPYFDYISPMTYPSHYASGSFGFKNPADHPYEIIYKSVEKGLQRMEVYRTKASTTPMAKLRPWFQDFDLGAIYTAPMIRKQIQALDDVSSTTQEKVAGWLLWDPSNNYTPEALAPAE